VRFVVAIVSLGVLCGSRAGAMPISQAARLEGVLPVYADTADSDPGPVPDALPADSALIPDGKPVNDGQFADGQFAPPAGSSAGPNEAQTSPRVAPDPKVPVDANGNPIPLERQQPQRILGFMPNFRSVSSGAAPHPLGWKYNFSVATHQATDYSSFIFLGLTSLTAEGTNEHAALGKGAGGFYAYSWRGFLDKSDNTYLSAWLLPSTLHEDTRFYALGNEHSIPIRALYVISRQGVAKTYGGRQTPNIAGLGGKALAQVFSRFYYPPSATSFAVLASKFGYSVMRDVIFSSIREFYPDAAAHFVRKHQAKMAAKAAQSATVQ
jgi:hypothetical protein